MVSKKEMQIVEKFQFFDEHGELPDSKVRIDITISLEALEKLKDYNRSGVINDLILASY